MTNDKLEKIATYITISYYPSYISALKMRDQKAQ